MRAVRVRQFARLGLQRATARDRRHSSAAGLEGEEAKAARKKRDSARPLARGLHRRSAPGDARELRVTHSMTMAGQVATFLSPLPGGEQRARVKWSGKLAEPSAVDVRAHANLSPRIISRQSARHRSTFSAPR